MEDNMNSDGFVSLKGEFLIAMPEMSDPNFSGTVTCICEHTDGGAFGVIVNRVTPVIKAVEIFKEFGINHEERGPDFPIYVGGPVQTDEIFILHGPPFDWEGTHMITQDLALSNTLDILEAMAGGRGPRSAMITIGCAGWGAGQLEYELKENIWLTCPVDSGILFDVPVDDRWNKAIESFGFDPLLLSSHAGHA